jgi:mutator protein MutT
MSVKNIIKSILGSSEEIEFSDSELLEIKHQSINQEYRIACNELVDLHKSYDEYLLCLNSDICATDDFLEKSENDSELLYNKKALIRRKEKFEEDHIESLAKITSKTLLLRENLALVKAELENSEMNYTSVGIIRDPDDYNKILFLQRHMDDWGGGMWNLPGGKIEEGESALDAVKREVEEETNLVVESAFLLKKIKTKNNYLICYYDISCEKHNNANAKPIALLDGEHQRYEFMDENTWMSRDDLLLDLKIHLEKIFPHHDDNVKIEHV